MKKGDFISFIQHPESVNENNINDLQNIVSEFPYFQSAQILLCKAFYQGENINFESQLRKTAAFSADRKQLHHILYSTNLNQTVAPIDGIENKNIEEQINETSAEKEVPNEVETSIRGGSPKPSYSTEKINPKESAESKGSSKETDFIERQILTEAINSSILLEIDQTEKEESKSSIDKNKESATANENDLQTTAFTINKSKIEKTQSFDDKANHSFSDWINHFKKADNNEAQHFDSKDQTEKNTNIHEKTEIKKQHFYSASKMAKLSVQEDGDLVTETLAKIYIAQESYDKAISAYEKLQLKYPEKKVYFAAQIKALKNQLKL